MVLERKYAFFLGCIMPNRYPQIEKSTHYLMKKLGYELLDMEKASCCPAPGVLRSFNKVDWMVVAARNLCIAEKMNVDLLTVCSGCFGTLKDVNTRLQADEALRLEVNEYLKKLGDYEYQGTIKVKHIAELLALDIGIDKIQPYLIKKLNNTAAVHYGCHILKPSLIHQIDSSEGPTFLEDYLVGLGVKSLEFKQKLSCCGAGGGVKSAFSDMGMAIIAEKMKNINAVHPDFIFDVCPFCHLQFESGQDWLKKKQNINYDIPVIHISQITAYCMGMDENMGLQYQNNGKDFKFTVADANGNES
ncbi:MAG: CoB--CoM heterodisulfide reductase subunit B [Promethearchaeota archaeon]